MRWLTVAVSFVLSSQPTPPVPPDYTSVPSFREAPAEIVPIASPAKAVVCEPTVIPVTVPNTSDRDRVVKVALYTGDAQAEFETAPGVWTQVRSGPVAVDDQQFAYIDSPTVTVPARTTMVARFRLAFHGADRIAISAAVIDPTVATSLVRPAIPIELVGPRLVVDAPEPTWLASGQPRTVGLHLRNETTTGFPGLILRTSSINAPSDKRRNADGWTVDTSVRDSPWNPLPLESNYGWSGEIPIGSVTAGESVDMRVRVQSTKERDNRPLDFEVRQGDCVVAARKYRVDLLAEPPPSPTPSPTPPPAPSPAPSSPPWILIGAVAAAVVGAAGWWASRRRRTAKSGRSTE